MYDFVQTFFFNPASVDNSAEVQATSVFLYFKRKPHVRKNRSGIEAPGAIVQLIECDGEQPNPVKRVGPPIRVAYDDIYALRDASAPTIFSFPQSVTLQTNRFYGIAIQLEDKGFRFWLNQQGRRVIGTNNNSSGRARARDGSLYRAVGQHYDHYWKQIIENVRNDSSDHIREMHLTQDEFKPVKNKDLKFAVNIAKYNTNPDGTGGVGNTTPSSTINLVNKNYEFFTVNSVSGIFKGGETVFANNSLSTGTVSVVAGNTTVTGSGTTFTSLVDGDAIVITSGNTNYAGIIDNIANNTILKLTQTVPLTNSSATFRAGITADVVSVDYVLQKMVLGNSSAKTGVAFANGHLIRGVTSNAYATIQSVDNLSVDRLVPHIKLGSQTVANTEVTFDIAIANGANFAVEGSYEPITDNQELSLVDNIGYLLSRSNEVGQANLFNTERKSAVIKVGIGSSNAAHSAPRINVDEADVVLGGYRISNTYLTQASNGTYYDSETDNHGVALSKYITQHFQFTKNQFAEDLRVFVVAHKPDTTELRVYAKLHNSTDDDTFDDKKWTLLECVDGANTFSSLTDLNDVITYEYGLPDSPETELTVSGSFTTSSGNAVVVGTSGSVNTAISIGRLVKVYSPYFEDNYTIGRVVAANTTTFTLDNPVTDSNVLGSGFLVDLLLYTNSAFNNKQNDNVVRYYNSSGAALDKYDAMQIKVVQLADSTNIIPRVAQVQGIGVSA
jgi:hypothetical protein